MKLMQIQIYRRFPLFNSNSKLNRNAGTHNRPQTSVVQPNVSEWTKSFPHFRVVGKKINSPDYPLVYFYLLTDYVAINANKTKS